jgi:SPP1 family predicted phage head-tail adaptor
MRVYDRHIEILRPVETVDDSGQMVKSWEHYCYTYAKRDFKGGQEGEQALRIAGKNVYNYFARYYSGIERTFRIIDDGKTLEITAIDEFVKKREYKFEAILLE